MVFLGQSEAPLLVAPHLKRRTRSELYSLMSGGLIVTFALADLTNAALVGMLAM